MAADCGLAALRRAVLTQPAHGHAMAHAAHLSHLSPQMHAGRAPEGTRGERLGHIVVILAGVFALVAVLLTTVSEWLQFKNYRKPLLQRYVVRILFMVPFFSAASWASLVSLKAAFWIDPFRDVYEAFVIYAFFQLLINFIGGERALIILMHGRAPVSHPWPLGLVLNKVDISDPHTFLAIKRGILQYTWLKPVLSIATIVMKATGTYQEGYIGLGSGYFWSGLFYNISITVSLYALAMFWVCMSSDLQPFRPMPKFLCIKGIIFASYWQGFFLSILVWLGALPDSVPGYTPDNVAASIQAALICFEMPIFAVAHWYAFSWKDYADVTISAARMPVKYAIRDAVGVVDLIQDAKETFAGSKYEYRYFDAGDDVLAHEESQQRVARMMEGMRYERGGKGKYWIPKPGQPDAKTPLLGRRDRGGGVADSNRSGSVERLHKSNAKRYDTNAGDDAEEPELDDDDEALFANARALEFGDWNATREDRLYRDPRMMTSATNRHILQPTTLNKRRRKSQIDKIQRGADRGTRGGKGGGKGKHRGSSASPPRSESPAKSPSALNRVLPHFLRRNSGSPASHSRSRSRPNEDRTALVDLVVEDDAAEQVERVRARKEGSPSWNQHEPRHFVRTFPDDGEAEVVREGHEPARETTTAAQQATVDEGLDDAPRVGGPDGDGEAAGPSAQWTEREHGTKGDGDDNPWKLR